MDNTIYAENGYLDANDKVYCKLIPRSYALSLAEYFILEGYWFECEPWPETWVLFKVKNEPVPARLLKQNRGYATSSLESH